MGTHGQPMAEQPIRLHDDHGHDALHVRRQLAEPVQWQCRDAVTLQSAKQQEKQETKKEEAISDNSSVTQADEAVPPKVIATETITKDDINLPETSTESIEKPSDANTLKELETDTNTDISSNTENDVNNTKASKAKILTVLCIIAILGLGYTGTRMIAKAPETNATTATNTSVTTENTQEEVEVTEIDFSKPMEFSIPDVSFSMIPCKKGSFIMGSPENELGRETNEQQHKVDITDSFFIGKYEVTQDLYFSVMKENPSRYKGSNKPVDSISWAMAKNFCTRLNKLTVKTRPANYIFDLPTIRPNNIAPLEKDASRSGEVSSVTVEITNLRTIIKEVVRKSTEGVDLSEAKIVVAGGRDVNFLYSSWKGAHLNSSYLARFQS